MSPTLPKHRQLPAEYAFATAAQSTGTSGASWACVLWKDGHTNITALGLVGDANTRHGEPGTCLRRNGCASLLDPEDVRSSAR